MSNCEMTPGNLGRLGELKVNLAADDAAGVVAASDLPDARALVVQFTVNGQACAALVRLHYAASGVFLDLVVDQDVATLDRRVGALDLATRGHPAPRPAAIDTTAMIEARGRAV